MNAAEPRLDDLRGENAELRQQLEECSATIRAISAGEVDAFLVRQGAEDQVLVLDGVDRPYRLLIEQMQQGAITTTSDGTIIYANRCFADMMNLPLPSLPGTRLTEHVCDPDHLRLLSLLGSSLEGRGSAELTLCRPDGSQLPVLVTASVLQHEAQVLCLVVTDLTQQKSQEHERELLVQAQAARNAAEQAAAVLRETDRRKDEFLAMLAHELRNPLASLRTGLQVLNRINSQEPNVQQTRAMMERQVENLVRLVDDLLDVGRVTQGKIKLQKERTDLSAIVARALETSRPIIAARGLSLEVFLAEAPLPVEADMMRAAQVLINLLNNAAKFTPQGGSIRLTVERTGDMGVVRVKDSGVGIAPEMLPKVFDLFMQADPTASRTEGGLGIGLTLSRRLMELHGGSLEAASAGLGQGSEFTARFPLATTEAPASAETARPAPAKKGPAVPRRILIVDDNRDAANSLGLLLKLLGHEVRQTYDGRQALEVAAEFLPEVVLLDIGLPGMSGYAVAAEMRAQPALQQVRLVALTGYGSDDDRHRSRAAGFHDHLVKPVDLPALEMLLAALVPVALS
jgi:PAS domain S-box-containing protein